MIWLLWLLAAWGLFPSKRGFTPKAKEKRNL